MREVLNAVGKIISYAGTVGLELSSKEAELIVGYIIEGNSYHFEVDSENRLFRVDDCFSNEEDVDESAVEEIVFSDIVEQLVQCNAELIECALSDLESTDDSEDYANLTEYLSGLIADDEIISNLWKRICPHLTERAV